LPSNVESVRSQHVSETAVEAITSCLRSVADEPYRPTAHQALGRSLCVLTETGPDFRSVDADKPYALVATADSSNDGIAVYYASDLASQYEPLSRRVFALR